MTRKELLEFHDKICTEAKDLMVAKNSDYASDSDPFANFRMFGDGEAALGIVYRLGDKLRRLHKASKGKDFAVAESIDDTVKDIINYAILFKAITN